MSNKDRSALIKRAASLPKNSSERRAILAGLSKTSGVVKATVGYVANFGLLVQLPGSQVVRIDLDKIDFEELMQGKSVSATVELPTSDETPAYIQKEVNAAREDLSSALSRLTALTKRF